MDVGGIELAALPPPVSTGSGSKGFSQSLRGTTPALYRLLGIPLAAVWDYTCRSHDNAAYAECAADQLSPGWRRDGGRVRPGAGDARDTETCDRACAPHATTQNTSAGTDDATPRAARRAPTASARSGMAITVTSPQGATLSGVQRRADGADRTRRRDRRQRPGQFPRSAGRHVSAAIQRRQGDGVRKGSDRARRPDRRRGRLARVQRRSRRWSCSRRRRCLRDRAPAAGPRVSRSPTRSAICSRRSTWASSRVAKRCSPAAATSARR